MVGPFNDGIKIRIKSPPTEGAANDELVLFLSKILQLPRKDIEILYGHTSRTKMLEIKTERSPETVIEQLCQDL